jgi:hypothetical protein
MTIESLADNMTQYLEENCRPSACSEAEIAIANNQFYMLFGQLLPEAYKKVLSRANGIKHNGLIIWPIYQHPLFHETIFEANNNLREGDDNHLLYFGNMDDELYVFDTQKQQYCAIEFCGKSSVWNEFKDDTEMFIFMMKRAWG